MRRQVDLIFEERKRLWGQINELKDEYDEKYADFETIPRDAKSAAVFQRMSKVVNEITRSLGMGNKGLSILKHKMLAETPTPPSVARTLKVVERTLLDLERLRASLAKAIYDLDVLRAKVRAKKSKNGRA